ncbi:unnamed protein product, partial [Ectocarpus sp. 4 AP-2014]
MCDLYKNGTESEFPFLHGLIDAGAQVNYDRPLEDVAETNTRLLSTLIGMGAHANGGWHFRRQVLSSPLHECITNMTRGVFEILIESGADVNWVDRFGRTAMM